MNISHLSKLGSEDFQSLALLDGKLVEKYGHSFSDEAWNADNFTYELPGKYALSRVLYLNDQLVGYCIASEKSGGIYIHRFAVAQVAQGLAGKFFKKVMQGFDRPVYLMVNTQNRVAIAFYKGFGFETVDNSDTIRRFIAADLKINNNEIIITKDYRCYLLKKD